MMDIESTNASNIGNEETQNLNLGVYPALRVEKLKIFNGTKPGAAGKTYFKCVFTVVEAANGHQVGELVQMFETLAGSGYPHFDGQAVARMKRLLGAIAGLSTDADINAKVKNADLTLAVSDAQPFRGSIVSAVVSGKNPKFPNVVCSPALGASNDNVTVPTVPAVDHKARAIALGYLPHPMAQGFHYMGQSVKSDLDLSTGNF